MTTPSDVKSAKYTAALIAGTRDSSSRNLALPQSRALVYVRQMASVGTHWILAHTTSEGTRWSGGPTENPETFNWVDSREAAYQFESVNSAMSMKSSLMKRLPIKADELVLESIS
jgi:hypothetical protein